HFKDEFQGIEMAGLLAGPTWGQGDSSDEGSDEDLLFEVNESEDGVEEISDEEDDAAVRGAIIDCMQRHGALHRRTFQTLQFEPKDKAVWSNNIPTTGRRSIVYKWTPRDNVQEYIVSVSIDMIDGIVNWTNVYATKTPANVSVPEETAEYIPEIGGHEEVVIKPSEEEGSMGQSEQELATDDDVEFLTDTGALVDSDDEEDLPLKEWPETTRISNLRLQRHKRMGRHWINWLQSSLVEGGRIVGK
ncbi:unnamed protein product, partial [Allacma fusca]